MRDAFSQQAWGICGACGHPFVFGAQPAPVDVFVLCLKRARCPRCGERRRLFVADHRPTPEDCERILAQAKREAD